MSEKSEAIKEWRRNTKAKIVAAMGGCCQICKYSKCNSALELHHIDPLDKELTLSQALSNPKKWEALENELSKCILLCSNCHKEVHAGITSIPKNYQKYDFSLIPLPLLKGICSSNCPTCGKIKINSNRYCSRACSAKSRKNVELWGSIDIIELVEVKKLSYVAIGKLVGCSDVAAKKRYIKVLKDIAPRVGLEPTVDFRQRINNPAPATNSDT